MKYLRFVSLVFITAVLFISCEKSKIETLAVKDFSHSDCKNNSKKSLWDEPETIILKTISTNELRITRRNVIFNCCPGELKVKISFTNDTIISQEYSTKDLCNCICPYDLEYSIENLEYGNLVFLITTKDADAPYKFKFDLNFDSNTDTTIILP